MKGNQKFSAKNSTKSFSLKQAKSQAEPTRVTLPQNASKPQNIPRPKAVVDFSEVEFGHSDALQVVPEASFVECKQPPHCEIIPCIKSDQITVTGSVKTTNATITNLVASIATVNNLTVATETVNNSTITNATITNLAVATETVDNATINTLTAGDLTVDGQFSLKDPVTISVPTLFGSADFSKPTIQSAIDYFAGRHAMNGTILLAPGKYLETVRIDRFSSAPSDLNISAPRNGFTIVGDERLVVSTTYLQAGYNSNPGADAGMGSDLSTVALTSAANVITVTLSPGPNPDFVVAGVLVGDKIKIRSSATETWTDATVTAVLGNTITHNGGTIDVNGVRSAFVIAPDVQILGTVTDQPIMFVSGAAVNLIGLWFDTSIANGSVVLPSNTLTILKSYNLMANCLFDVSTFNSSHSNVLVSSSSRVWAARESTFFDGFDATNTMIGTAPGNDMLNSEFNSTTNMGYLSMLDSPTSLGFGWFLNGTCTGTAVLWQCVAATTGIQPYRGSHADILIYVILKSTSGILPTKCASVTLGTSGFPSKIDCNSAANSFGIVMSRGCYLRLAGSVNVSNASTGIAAVRSSKISLDAASTTLTFTNVTDADVLTEYLSTWDSMRLAATPDNIFNNAVSTGSQGLRNEYPDQTISALVAISFNPSGTASGARKYQGKTYRISLIGAAGIGSTITLTAGSWVSHGFGGLVRTFAVADATIEFRVETGNRVRVISWFGMT